jgi:hypothetical protein
MLEAVLTEAIRMWSHVQESRPWRAISARCVASAERKGSKVASMRRTIFRYAALALVAIVVLAPRPLASTDLPTTDQHGDLLINRALVPSIDAIDVRERASARAWWDAAPMFWVLCVLTITVGALRFHSFGLIDHCSARHLVSVLGVRGSRAPPLVLA